MSHRSRLAAALVATTAVLTVSTSPVSAASDSGTSRVPSTVRVARKSLNTDAVVAKKLKTTVKKLRAAIKAGASISQIAAEKGTSADLIISAVLDKATALLNAEVAAGRMTQAAADAALAKLKDTFGAIVNKALNAGDHGARGPVDMFDEEKLATLLGITEKQLENELDTGVSLLTVATNHGITQDALVAFLTTEATARIDAAVTAGKITQAQADEMKAAMPAKIEAFINRIEPRTRKPEKHDRAPEPIGDLITKKDVATAIGITEDQLERELKGVSVADVALAHGVAIQTLSDTLNNVAVARIDAAVAAGKITGDQAKPMKDSVPALVNSIINQVRGVKSSVPTVPGAPTTTVPGAAASTVAYLDLKETFFKASAAAIGVSTDTLEKQMKSGVTVLQVAVAKGGNSETLISSLVNAGKERVNKALGDRRINQQQADAYVAGLAGMANGFITTIHHED